jgi:hypothetical protein
MELEMASTPKPVRKAVKKDQAIYRKELKEEPRLKARFLKGKKGAMSVAKRSLKHLAHEGKVSRKGKLHPSIKRHEKD